jgi:hypothetical protein
MTSRFLRHPPPIATGMSNTKAAKAMPYSGTVTTGVSRLLHLLEAQVPS